VLAENDRIGTLIFDEIDTGISGRTAQMVSEKMSHIAKDHQVICITHLPQIAAMADTHFAIEKQTQGGNTTTHIRTLTEEETVSELARMSGGVAITERTMENAKEMRRMALLAKKTK
jgi:DNA repair protein RecN (Recombination protein N)